MTKLMRWLAAVGAFLALWLSLLTETLPINYCSHIREIVWPLPIYLLICFACYSLGVIGYRVTTFNDCVEASEELKQEVEEARKDLKKKGFKFT